MIRHQNLQNICLIATDVLLRMFCCFYLFIITSATLVFQKDLIAAQNQGHFDSPFAEEWWLKQIRYQEALKIFSKLPQKNQPIVAVLDGGVDTEHPALKKKIFHNANMLDTGCPGDLTGCNVTINNPKSLGDGTSYPAGTDGEQNTCPANEPVCSHATEISGIIALCPSCLILNVKTMSSSVGVNDHDLTKGLQYVLNIHRLYPKQMRVVNISLGKHLRSKKIRAMIEKLTSNGILVVSASGNDNSNYQAYPAAFPEVIAVAATNKKGLKARYSNFGDWVALSAPGGEFSSQTKTWDWGIKTLVPGGGESVSQGTSLAAPFVSATIGMILTVRPELTADQVKQILLQSANPSIYLHPTMEQYMLPPSTENTQNFGLLGRGVLDMASAMKHLESKDGFYTIDDNSPNCGFSPPPSSSCRWLIWAMLLFMPIFLVIIPTRIQDE